MNKYNKAIKYTMDIFKNCKITMINFNYGRFVASVNENENKLIITDDGDNYIYIDLDVLYDIDKSLIYRLAEVMNGFIDVYISKDGIEVHVGDSIISLDHRNEIIENLILSLATIKTLDIGYNLIGIYGIDDEVDKVIYGAMNKILHNNFGYIHNKSCIWLFDSKFASYYKDLKLKQLRAFIMHFDNTLLITDYYDYVILIKNVTVDDAKEIHNLLNNHVLNKLSLINRTLVYNNPNNFINAITDIHMDNIDSKL